MVMSLRSTFKTPGAANNMQISSMVTAAVIFSPFFMKPDAVNSVNRPAMQAIKAERVPVFHTPAQLRTNNRKSKVLTAGANFLLDALS